MDLVPKSILELLYNSGLQDCHHFGWFSATLYRACIEYTYIRAYECGHWLAGLITNDQFFALVGHLTLISVAQCSQPTFVYYLSDPLWSFVFISAKVGCFVLWMCFIAVSMLVYAMWCFCWKKWRMCLRLLITLREQGAINIPGSTILPLVHIQSQWINPWSLMLNSRHLCCLLFFLQNEYSFPVPVLSHPSYHDGRLECKAYAHNPIIMSQGDYSMGLEVQKKGFAKGWTLIWTHWLMTT